MSSSDSSASMSISDCETDLNRILERYENAAKIENNYLLHMKLSVGAYELGCGLSPARTFSPAIILSEPYKVNKISFSTFEWETLIELLKQKLDDFFWLPIEGYSDEYDPITFPCGDYATVTQFIYDERTKFLGITKHGINIELQESDVTRILEVNASVLTHRVSMLENLDFCSYYYNVVNMIMDFVEKYPEVCVGKLELLKAFYDSSPDTI